MKKLLTTIFVFTLISGAIAQQSRSYNNPIIPGYHPDPSICRVGEDYYLVNSSFESFPGVPIFHSRDLVNWEQIGNVLDRPSQLDMGNINPSAGIYAPTIRYNNGKFYMITTVLGKHGIEDKLLTHSNFYVTATNPAGPWSDPVRLPDAPSIDPSMFFDDDGKVYCLGKQNPKVETYRGHRQIWLRELDEKSGKLIGEHTVILPDGGAVRGAVHAEGPHIYKRNGYYYLLIAEGGTDDNHAVTVFRSRNIRGPYDINPKNPVLTNRHLGRDFPVQNTGHADLVETQNGEWWAVLLACRPYGGGDYPNLARETFMVPVTWERDWPVFAPGVGHVALSFPAPNLPEHKFTPKPATDDFNSDKLGFEWNFMRTPKGDFWSLSERKGFLRLKLKPEMASENVNQAFVGRRQEQMNFTAWTAMEFVPKTADESTGLVVSQTPNFHYRLELKGASLTLTQRKKGVETVVSTLPVTAKKLYLRVSAVGQDYTFYYATQKDKWVKIATVDGRILNSPAAGGFTGVYIGMYASSNGKPSTNYADFDSFTYTADLKK